MPGERRETNKSIGYFLILLLSFCVTALDQLSKFIIQRSLEPDLSIPVIKDIFHLTLVFNTGAAFGIFKARNFIFITIAAFAIIFILSHLPRLRREGIMVKISIALILGGIIGNLIDRLRFGYVVDFLDFRVWPVFNLADSAITVGAVIMCVKLIFMKEKKQQL